MATSSARSSCVERRSRRDPNSSPDIAQTPRPSQHIAIAGAQCIMVAGAQRLPIAGNQCITVAGTECIFARRLGVASGSAPFSDSSSANCRLRSAMPLSVLADRK
jgi:hypothetical protein